MTDNEEIQYQLTLGRLETLNVPMSFVENVDLTNSGTQAAILDCLTEEQIVAVLAAHGGEENGN